MCVVVVEGLNKSFNKHPVLKDVSFSIKKGEIVGFIGPNGSGKSTTMKCIASLIFPDSGKIIINNHDLQKEREAALSDVAVMIENPGLYPNLSGYENLMYFASMHGVNKQRVDKIIEFTGLKDKIKRKAGQYSLGMKQRLGLGIALLNKPKFLILDEPTNGLDPKGIMELREELRILADKDGVSILISSHQLGEIEKVADRIICINKGQIIPTPINIENYDAYIIKFDREYYEKAKALVFEKASFEWKEGETKVHFKDENGLNEYLSLLMKEKIYLREVIKEVVDIETIYRETFGDETC